MDLDPETSPLRRRSVLDINAKLLTVGASAAYNIGLIAMSLFVVNMWIDDLRQTGKVKLQVEFLLEAFAGMDVSMGIWLAMVVSITLMQMCFQGWTKLRAHTSKQSLSRLVCERCGLVAALLYLALLLVLPAAAVRIWSLPPGSSIALLAEQMRLLMKAYAYLRTQVAAVLREYDGDSEPNLTLSHFLYFLFAPTLVYRDQYARTTTVRVEVVIRHLLELTGCLLMGSEVFVRGISSLSHEFLQRLRHRQGHLLDALGPGLLGCAAEWLLLLVQAVPSCTLLLMIIFYLMLHAVQNAFAEVLRFRDRCFFMDWWNVSSFRTYYRTWNRIVQMWLYTYIYKEVKTMGAKSFLAKLIVFTISALFHEFLLSVAVGFVYPVQYCFFGILGFVFSFEPDPKANNKHHNAWDFGNLLFLIRILFGMTILIMTYTVECQARTYCPRQIKSSWDFVIPRSWFCQSSIPKTKFYQDPVIPW